MSTAATLSPSAVPAAPAPTLLGWINLGLLAVLAAALTALLWPQWLHNPDLTHGLFMPVIFLLLVHEARTGGVPRYLPATALTRTALCAALALGLLLLAAGGLYAAALEWSHALVGFMLAAALSLLLLAALIGFSADSVRLVPFNWSSLLAAGLWVMSAPIPPGSYARLTLALQLRVSENVLHALHLLGIAASRHGNIIELARTSVGIEEACSGVRSLISCVFAGFFFSGCLVRRPWARVLIIGLAAPLALLMNFIRSLTLTLLANAGVDITGRWHDVTGFAVLGCTAAMLGGLALLLERRESAVPAAAPVPRPPSGRGANPQPLLAGGFACAVVLAAFFGLHDAFTPRLAPRPRPDLEAVLPLHPAGWQVVTSDDLNRFKDALQTDQFVQRTYAREAADGGVLQITAYIAYWAPGQASASLVATHTPDACWPGAGWTPVPVPPDQMRVRLPAGNRELATAEYRRFSGDGFPQHVWFWHIYDRQPVRYIDPLSPRNLLEIAARYGFRQAGDQMFVRLSSNHPWADFAQEPLIAQILSNLQPLGL
jgi:exosortase